MKGQSYRRPEPGAGKPIECNICGRRLVDKRSLRQHVAATHPVPADDHRVVGSTSGEARPL